MEKRIMDSWGKRVLSIVGTRDAMAAARKHNYYVSVARFPMNMPSYWDGGSKSFYDFVKLSTGEHISLPSNHPVFEPGRPYTMREMPADCIIVETGVFCGKTAHAHIYVKSMEELPVL